MEAQSTIKIILFSESEENSSDGSIQAQCDKVMPVSIVSKGVLKQMKLKYVPGKKEPVKDSRNVIYALVGQVDLRWHKEGQAKSYAETFYVVDQQTPLVILRYSAFEKSNKSAGGTIYPVGVQQQTAEENAILERKRQDAASRRAKEEQEQEENEAVSDAAKFAQEGAEFVQTRHVRFNFSLFRDGHQCLPSKEQERAIMELFPTTFKLSFCAPYLLIVCSRLPAKPWPVTVAGLPLFLTTDPTTLPMDFGLTSHGPKTTIKASVERWKTPDLEAFKQLLAVLNDLGADIHRLQWIGWCFLALRASQPSYDWRIRLPAFVNKIRIGYVFREQTVEEKAVRRKVPAGKVTDNEVYQQLRPGVMVASELDAAHDTLSTSGVILEAPTGEKYLSVAKHGFQGGVGDLVYHPSRCGRVIGRVAKVFGETDIALAELADIRYSRETFSALDADVCPFGKILDTSELVIGDFVYLDTPFNGRCEGTLQRVEVARLPSDEPNEDTTYVVGIFAYIGNGSHILLEGCCGAVIWDDNHDILGQFRYQEKTEAGECYCPSFAMLRRLGYTISEA